MFLAYRAASASSIGAVRTMVDAYTERGVERSSNGLPARGLTQGITALSIVFFSVLLMPVNWLFGTSILWFAAAAVGLLLWGDLKVRLATGLLLGLCGTLFISVIIHALDEGNFGSREVAALYNILVLLCAAAFMAAGERHGFALSRKIGSKQRGLILGLFAIQAGYILAAYALGRATGRQEESFRSIVLGHLGSLPGILSYYSRIVVFNTDWLSSGATTRPFGFGVYSTEGALIFALTALAARLAAAPTRTGLWLRLAIDCVALVVLFVMGSRMVAIGYVGGLMFELVFGVRSIRQNAMIALPFVVAICALVFLTTGAGSTLQEGYSGLLSVREGSSKIRMLSYTTAIRMTVDQNPMFGLGIKPLDETRLHIPIGSHSAFISIFTKGGIISLTMFVAVLVSIISTQIARLGRIDHGLLGFRADQRLTLVRAVILTVAWMVAEDIDAAIMGTCLAFLFIGLSLSADREAPQRVSGHSKPEERRAGPMGVIE